MAFHPTRKEWSFIARADVSFGAIALARPKSAKAGRVVSPNHQWRLFRAPGCLGDIYVYIYIYINNDKGLFI